jgi:hypothetical protein
VEDVAGKEALREDFLLAFSLFPANYYSYQIICIHLSPRSDTKIPHESAINKFMPDMTTFTKKELP